MKKQIKKVKLKETHDLDSTDINFKDFFSHLNKDTVEEKPEEFNAPELQKGSDEEHEHTDDDTIAQKIAMDHLKEDPHYYSNMEKCKSLGDISTAVVVNPDGGEENIEAGNNSEKLSASGPHITGDIDGTPLNKTISSVNEGGAKITEPRAGITSDMTKDGKPARWSINAYPNKGKITPKI
jgi:hypothetical protein